MTPQLRAFLSTVSVSEGTDGYGAGEDGIDNSYRVIVGSTHDVPDLMTSFEDHPRKYVYLSSLCLESSAAGRYQILARYFDAYKRSLKLPDFGPASQDAIALRLIDECNARNYINSGNFDYAVKLCRSRWASLPLAGYGQHENKMSDLRVAFVQSGGIIV